MTAADGRRDAWSTPPPETCKPRKPWTCPVWLKRAPAWLWENGGLLALVGGVSFAFVLGAWAFYVAESCDGHGKTRGVGSFEADYVFGHGCMVLNKDTGKWEVVE